MQHQMEGGHEARHDGRVRWPRPSRVRVSLVVPALNEERNLAIVLPRIPEFVDEVILVDGASTDETVAISRRIRADIRVIGQTRPGKGNALRAGFAAARGDYIVMLDADGSMAPEEIARFVEALDSGYDLVKGSRFLPGGGTSDMDAIRRWGNRWLCGVVNGLYGADFTDLCYGFFAFRRSCLEDLALRTDGFEIETELVVRALLVGLQVAEVASYEERRVFGESHLHTWRDGGRVLRTAVSRRLARRAPAIPTPAEAAAPTPQLAPARLQG